MRNARDAGATRVSLRRLASLTIRNFPARDLPSPDLFWKAIGREGSPMLDPWGVEYRISAEGEGVKRNFTWSSAGPDRVFGTPDDIAVLVPYPDRAGSLPDLGPGEELVPPTVSIDAK